MNPADFLAQLAARGVVVATDGADLLFEGPDAVLTEKVLDFMRKCKPALLQLVPEVVGFGPAGEPIPYPRCVDCGKALPRNQRRCPAGACDRRPVASCRGFPPPVLWPGTREEWAAGVSLAEVRPDASCAVGRTVRRTEGEAVAV